MKKFLTLLAIATTCAAVANAQPATSADHEKDMKGKRFENASPEQKAHMLEMKKKFDALSPEQKAAVKKERERHREEMKKITGFDLPERGGEHQ